jgi:hypothetical protein
LSCSKQSDNSDDKDNANDDAWDMDVGRGWATPFSI